MFQQSSKPFFLKFPQSGAVTVDNSAKDKVAVFYASLKVRKAFRFLVDFFCPDRGFASVLHSKL